MKPPPTHGVVLFDGTCAFCEGAVRFIATHDPHDYFRFGASQSAAGRQMLADLGLVPELTRSIVLIEGATVSLRSTASLRIAARLSYPWRAASVLLWVPRPLRDAAYRVVAAIRHRIAGRSNACDVPPPEIRARMI